MVQQPKQCHFFAFSLGVSQGFVLILLRKQCLENTSVPFVVVMYFSIHFLFEKGIINDIKRSTSNHRQYYNLAHYVFVTLLLHSIGIGPSVGLGNQCSLKQQASNSQLHHVIVMISCLGTLPHTSLQRKFFRLSIRTQIP